MGDQGSSRDHAPTFRDALEARMLSGEPFTYGGLCKWRAELEQGAIKTHIADHDRLVDRTIQKMRRKGLIEFYRAGGAVTWRPTSSASQIVGDSSRDESQ